MATARYWRIRALSGKSLFAAAIVELRNSSGVDQTGSGTPYASTSFDANRTPDKAFNGNPSNEWISSENITTPSTPWIAYDFGAGNDVEIAEFRLLGRTGNGNSQTPTEMVVEYSSDNANWTAAWTTPLMGDVLWSVTSPDFVFRDPAILPITGVTARFWRLEMTVKAPGTQPYSFETIDLKASASSLLTGAVANASTEFSGSTLAGFGLPGVSGIWAASGLDDPANYYIAATSSISPDELAITARNGSLAETQTPRDWELYHSDGGPWVSLETEVGGAAYVSDEVRTFPISSPPPPPPPPPPPAPDPEPAVSQFGVLAVVEGVAGGNDPDFQPRISQFGVLAVVDDTALARYSAASQLAFVTVVEEKPEPVQLSQFGTVVVVSEGVVEEDYNLQAWTFTLDGHEFYVLHIGEQGTWVFDVTTNQWSQWKTAGYERWNMYYGIHWYDDRIIAADGDNPILWELQPDTEIDEGFRRQTRIVTGVVDRRGISSGLNCGALRLTASVGDPETSATPTVNLRFSDDNGQTWVTRDAIELEVGDFTQRISWRGLGTIRAPGRIFEIEDVGGMVRIDDCILDTDESDR